MVLRETITGPQLDQRMSHPRFEREMRRATPGAHDSMLNLCTLGFTANAVDFPERSTLSMSHLEEALLRPAPAGPYISPVRLRGISLEQTMSPVKDTFARTSPLGDHRVQISASLSTSPAVHQ